MAGQGLHQLKKVKVFTKGSTIDTGMYFVVTDNYFPLKGNAWYFDDVVEKAIGYNLIKREDIKHQVKASYSLKPTHFKQFVDEVYEIFEPVQSNGGKLAINGFAGLLGKAHVSKRQVYVESDYDKCLLMTTLNSKAFTVSTTGLHPPIY